MSHIIEGRAEVTCLVTVTAQCAAQGASSNYPGHHEHTNCTAQTVEIAGKRLPPKLEMAFCAWITENFGDVGPLDDVAEYGE